VVGKFLQVVDTIFIERLWRSLMQEAVYLPEVQDGFHAKRLIKDWISYFNTERPQCVLDKRSPDEAFFDIQRTQKTAWKPTRLHLSQATILSE